MRRSRRGGRRWWRGRRPASGRAIAAAWLSLACAPAPGEDTIAALARDGAVTCRPVHRFFCRNIHVSCSGRTSVPTFPFQLEVAGDAGRITSASDPSGIIGRYQDASADWARDGTHVVLRPRGEAGYVKLLQTGTYSFRRYVRGVGVMSYGRCE